MGILSDREIEWMMEKEGLVIEPILLPIQSASVDLRLGNNILRQSSGQVVDPVHGRIPDESVKPMGNKHYLFPGQWLLAETLEYIEIPPSLVGILVGKSSLARFGLQIESAGYVDPGWKGVLTLEIKNLGEYTIVLRPEMMICQIRFEPVVGLPVQHPYGHPALNSHYQGSQGVQAGRSDPQPGHAEPDRPARTRSSSPRSRRQTGDAPPSPAPSQ